MTGGDEGMMEKEKEADEGVKKDAGYGRQNEKPLGVLLSKEEHEDKTK